MQLLEKINFKIKHFKIKGLDLGYYTYNRDTLYTFPTKRKAGRSKTINPI